MAPAVATKAYPAYAHFASQIPKKSITFSPITCALNLNGFPMLPSSFSQSDNKIDHRNKTSRVLLGASLVLACVIGIFNCSCRINPCLASQKAAFGSYLAERSLGNLLERLPPPHKKARSPEPILQSYSTNDALGALLEYFPSLEQKKTQIERSKDVDEDRNRAKAKVKLGRGSEALNELESQREVAKKKLAAELEKEASSRGVNENDIYELDLAIVEVLIILGSYKEALKRLEVYHRSDPRLSLYRVISLAMLAEQSWTEFRQSIGESVASLSVDSVIRSTSGRDAGRDFPKY